MNDWTAGLGEGARASGLVLTNPELTLVQSSVQQVANGRLSRVAGRPLSGAALAYSARRTTALRDRESESAR